MIGRAPTEPTGQERPGHDVPVAARLDRESRWAQVRGRYDPKLPRASDGARTVVTGCSTVLFELPFWESRRVYRAWRRPLGCLKVFRCGDRQVLIGLAETLAFDECV